MDKIIEFNTEPFDIETIKYPVAVFTALEDGQYSYINCNIRKVDRELEWQK